MTKACFDVWYQNGRCRVPAIAASRIQPLQTLSKRKNYRAARNIPAEEKDDEGMSDEIEEDHVFTDFED